MVVPPSSVSVPAARRFTLVVAASACSSDDNGSSGSSDTTPATSAGEISLTPDSFTADFSAMEQLKDLAAQGKGKIARAPARHHDVGALRVRTTART